VTHTNESPGFPGRFKPLRSHEEIAKAWQSDENVAVWLAVFFVLGGLYLSWAALRSRRGAT